MVEKKVMALAAVTTVIFLCFLTYGLYMNWVIDKDTTAWLYRAQVASNPIDMQSDLNNVMAGMEELDITSGHAALIFKTPENDMSLIVKSLKSCIDRCDYVRQFDKSSVQYQVALDDLRGVIRELDIQSFWAWWWMHGLAMLILIIASCLAMIGAWVWLFIKY